MPLTPATRLGPYEIVAPLGAGGMGEVYRARDTRLGREVALKVLPSQVAGDPARRARFEQEARATAALNHPNIVGVHDVGEQDGVYFLVTELVPGETLAALLERGPLPVRKLLDLAVQIADGMAAAHAARITHRDLKPANIIVTPEARAKILDFGLAKQTAFATASPDETMTVQQTEPGMILGTVAYMSPEQARGKPADHRSDQFSFGVILYEMAAGRKAFDKPESVQTMSAILTEEPPPIDRDIPAPLHWAIDRCLAKEPADRYESTRDLFQDLRNIRDHATRSSVVSGPAALPAARPRRRIRWVFPVVGTVGLVAAFALGRYFAGPRFPDQSRYLYTPFAFDPGGQSSPVWSPDGKSVAYAGHPDGAAGPSQVLVRDLDSPMPRRITRLAEDAVPIAWAPDSKRVLFMTRHDPAGIWSTSVVGGEPESFFPTKDRQAIAVSPDLGAIAQIRRGDDGVYSVWISAPPGSPPRKYTPDPIATRAIYNETRIRFSPDGKIILVFVKGDRGRDEIWRMPYPPDPRNPPKLAFPDLASYGGAPGFAWMPDSRRLVFSLSATPEAPTQLWLGDLASGKRMALTSGAGAHVSFAVSPDGTKIVFTEYTGSFDVISLDLERAVPQRWIATERSESMPAWAADGHALVYVSDRNGPYEIWLQDHAGDRPIVSPREFPAGTTQWLMGPALSPDGARVAYSRLEFMGGSRLWMSSVSGGSPVQMTNDSSAVEFPGSWSPDGSWLAYLAIRAGKMELIKVKTSGQATPTLVKSQVNCETPAWSPAGDWIVCGHDLLSADGQTDRKLPDSPTQNFAFSKDGKLLYGIRDEKDGEVLFSVDIATGGEKTIGSFAREFRPASNLHPAIRFSLAPDGKSIVYAAGTFHTNLWMLAGALTP